MTCSADKSAEKTASRGCEARSDGPFVTVTVPFLPWCHGFVENGCISNMIVSFHLG